MANLAQVLLAIRLIKELVGLSDVANWEVISDLYLEQSDDHRGLNGWS